MKYHLAWPNLRCEDCWQQYQDKERREFPCQRCPDERFGPIHEADRATQLYFRVVHYLNATPESTGGYPWDLICAMAGITDVETLREVWERMAIAKAITDEHREKRQPRTATR